MLSVNSLRQTVHTHCASVHQAAKLMAALLRVTGVTAGLVESNGSLPSGLWFMSPAGWLPRTGIISGTLRSVIEYGLPCLVLKNGEWHFCIWCKGYMVDIVTECVSLHLQDFSTECGICYAYRFNDEVPDQTCDDSHCVQTFHSSCLVEVCDALSLAMTCANNVKHYRDKISSNYTFCIFYSMHHYWPL